MNIFSKEIKKYDIEWDASSMAIMPNILEIYNERDEKIGSVAITEKYTGSPEKINLLDTSNNVLLTIIRNRTITKTYFEVFDFDNTILGNVENSKMCIGNLREEQILTVQKQKKSSFLSRLISFGEPVGEYNMRSTEDKDIAIFSFNINLIKKTFWKKYHYGICELKINDLNFDRKMLLGHCIIHVVGLINDIRKIRKLLIEE